MKVSAVDNIKSRKNSFRAASVSSPLISKEPSESFKKKKRYIYSITTPLFALASTFAFFYIFHKEATFAFFKGHFKEAKELYLKASNEIHK